MNLVIIGPGRMGAAVSSLAERQGARIVASVDGEDWDDFEARASRGDLGPIDAAIEFTLPDQAAKNIRRLVGLGIPTVVGTTGWHDQLDDVTDFVERQGGALVYGSNFSVGVYVFDRVVGFATQLFSQVDDVSAYLVEHHHEAKVDAPSGTAHQLTQTIRRSKSKRKPDLMSETPVTSVRAGHEPGRHTVGFDGPYDHVTLTHAARSREGFAAGALLAARLIQGRRGVYRFNDVLNEWFEVDDVRF